MLKLKIEKNVNSGKSDLNKSVKFKYNLKTLIRSRRRIAHIAVHFGRWRAKDQGANCTTTDLDILKTAQNMDSLIGQDDATFCHVFDCILNKMLFCCKRK